eukprot:9499179-Pyramimonas_sp.AAC.2
MATSQPHTRTPNKASLIPHWVLRCRPPGFAMRPAFTERPKGPRIARRGPRKLQDGPPNGPG